MLRLETYNELSLKVTSDGMGRDKLFTKAGAFVAGNSMGQKNYKFTKLLLGPDGNPLSAALNQILRRFTGENLPLMQVEYGGQSVTYFANQQQHVLVLTLQPGQKVSVESENILAFTENCRYRVRFLPCGAASQKGLVTSTLEAVGGVGQVAVLTDGNYICVSNMQTGESLQVDPDAMVCFVGADPGFGFDLSWKNLLGRAGASGESYMLEWGPNRPAFVVVQPNERTSGINIGMDGGKTGSRPNVQQNQSIGDAVGGIGDTLGGLLGGNGPTGGNVGGGILGGLLGR